MASPRIVSTLKRLPRTFDNVLDTSPRTPRNVRVQRQENEKLLSPFNIDTPNRMKILREGLPKKQCPVLGTGAFGTVYKAFYKGDQVAAKVIQRRQNDDETISSEGHAAILRHANIGTPGYAAPEVLRGDAPTFAADVYSLGIVAWQMLSRKAPFHGLHIHTIIYISAKGARPDDGVLDDEFGGDYRELYRVMWSQDVAERPALREIISRLDLLLNR
ncbi:PREDICTED: serine/threonine-protein kinase mos isoform X2 [Dinoponera quadriceps]|uniref:Serine/threonine-protein kinase mos isoform X2 n=1 Tax=Dinoponera quadriceps TaxID=609295 RepID=A0A6P3Y853_DINQU|nr:PREDICTED: serine/threonine-protein kinase mos isoform X2 [Dinoponera quadriceps]